MKKVLLAVAVLAFVFAPPVVMAQEAPEEPPAELVVAISSFKVPIGEARAMVMQFIERVITPQEKLNPNVQGFYVMTHYYGSDARDVSLARVYANFADIEAPCGEPCETWLEENMPEEGTAEYEEMQKLMQTFMKFYATHSDEIYSMPLSLAKY